MSECSNRDANVLKLHERQKRSHFPQLMKTALIQKMVIFKACILKDFSFNSLNLAKSKTY